MRIGELREMIKDCKDSDHIAIKFFTLNDAEQMYAPPLDDSIVEDNWEYIVKTWQEDEALTDIASHAFEEAILHNLPDKDER